MKYSFAAATLLAMGVAAQSGQVLQQIADGQIVTGLDDGQIVAGGQPISNGPVVARPGSGSAAGSGTSSGASSGSGNIGLSPYYEIDEVPAPLGAIPVGTFDRIAYNDPQFSPSPEITRDRLSSSGISDERRSIFTDRLLPSKDFYNGANDDGDTGILQGPGGGGDITQVHDDVPALAPNLDPLSAPSVGNQAPHNALSDSITFSSATLSPYFASASSSLAAGSARFDSISDEQAPQFLLDTNMPASTDLAASPSEAWFSFATATFATPLMPTFASETSTPGSYLPVFNNDPNAPVLYHYTPLGKAADPSGTYGKKASPLVLKGTIDPAYAGAASYFSSLAAATAIPSVNVASIAASIGAAAYFDSLASEPTKPASPLESSPRSLERVSGADDTLFDRVDMGFGVGPGSLYGDGNAFYDQIRRDSASAAAVAATKAPQFRKRHEEIVSASVTSVPARIATSSATIKQHVVSTSSIFVEHVSTTASASVTDHSAATSFLKVTSSFVNPSATRFVPPQTETHTPTPSEHEVAVATAVEVVTATASGAAPAGTAAIIPVASAGGATAHPTSAAPGSYDAVPGSSRSVHHYTPQGTSVASMPKGSGITYSNGTSPVHVGAANGPAVGWMQLGAGLAAVVVGALMM